MRIVLWDHYDAGMGGIEKLIVTLARDLSTSYDVVVICRRGGTAHGMLTRQRTRYSHVDPNDGEPAREVSPDDLLIDFGTYTDQRALSIVNPRLLLWRVFPSLGCKGVLETFLARSTFAVLERKDSLIFMDTVCHETACRELRRNFNTPIIPLPIIVPNRKHVVRKAGEAIRITYIGRGSRIWKVKPVKKLVADLRTLTDQAFHLHIFTDTSELFERELQGLKGGNVRVGYHFGYAMESLSEKLLELADIHYSMGTACLEGAVLGIPTLIADATYADFPDNYRYRWLIEDIENYAGVFLEHTSPEGRSLREIVDRFNDLDEMRHISYLTRNTVIKSFASERIVRAIETLRPQARLRDVLQFMPSYWLYGGPLNRLRTGTYRK